MVFIFFRILYNCDLRKRYKENKMTEEIADNELLKQHQLVNHNNNNIAKENNNSVVPEAGKKTTIC